MTHRLDLSDVTICSVDCVNPSLSLRAIARSQEFCRFGSALLLTDQPVETGAACERRAIGALSSARDYSDFMMTSLREHIETEFVLVVQWDGYTVDPNGWRDEFRSYDYIGARWPWVAAGIDMGNGGFSWRSRRLLNVLGSDAFPFIDNQPEDVQISQTHRAALEAQAHMRFAPDAVADRFAYEEAEPAQPTFGFHGFFNMWRYCSDDEMATICQALTPRTIMSWQYTRLLVKYFGLRKFAVLRMMFARWRQCGDREAMHGKLMRLTSDAALSDAMTSFFETCGG